MEALRDVSRENACFYKNLTLETLISQLRVTGGLIRPGSTAATVSAVVMYYWGLPWASSAVTRGEPWSPYLDHSFLLFETLSYPLFEGLVSQSIIAPLKDVVVTLLRCW